MSVMERVMRVPEARYSYYRRCQIFRKGGEQCKAPAEKGSHICYAHAGQLAAAVRRERERRAVLAEAGSGDAPATQAGIRDGGPVHGF